MNRIALRSVVAVVVILPLACRGGTGPGGGPPADVSIASGNNQRGATGQALPNPFVVRVSNQDGNDLAGVTVNWAVTGGGGTVSDASSVTTANGRASTTLTPGQVGPNTVSATVASLTPVMFTGVGAGVVTDPSGDEFSTSASQGLVPPDIVELRAWPQAGDLWVEIEFVDDVVSEATGGSNVAVGVVDIDTDQDPATGIVPITDGFRPGPGSTGLGSDYIVGPFTSQSDYDVVNAVSGMTVGTITPTYNGHTLSLVIPLAMLGGDDGLVSLATVMGTVPEPTDIAPENQSLMLDLTSGAARSGAASATSVGRSLAMPVRRPLEWGSWK